MKRSSFPFQLANPRTLRELLVQMPPPLLVNGDDGVKIDSVAPLDLGVAGSLVFSRFKGGDAEKRILASSATVVVCAEPIDAVDGRAFVHVEDPRGWFIDALDKLLDEPSSTGIDPTARIGGKVALPRDVTIGPFAVVEDGAEIGIGCRIGTHAFIGTAATLDEGARVASHASIGESGLSFHERPNGERAYFRHIGRVFVGAGSHIGTHSTIMRGIVDDTVIGRRAMIGNHVNVGHNCKISDDAFISSGSVLAGASHVGKGAVLGAGVRLSSHISVGENAVVGIGSVVVKDVADNQRVFGHPAKPLATMRRF